MGPGQIHAAKDGLRPLIICFLFRNEEEEIHLHRMVVVRGRFEESLKNLSGITKLYTIRIE